MPFGVSIHGQDGGGGVGLGGNGADPRCGANRPVGGRPTGGVSAGGDRGGVLLPGVDHGHDHSGGGVQRPADRGASLASARTRPPEVAQVSMASKVRHMPE